MWILFKPSFDQISHSLEILNSYFTEPNLIISSQIDKPVLWLQLVNIPEVKTLPFHKIIIDHLFAK